MLNIFWGSPQTAVPKQQSLALEGLASKAPLLPAARSSQWAALQGPAAAPSHTQALSKASHRKAQSPCSEKHKPKVRYTAGSEPQESGRSGFTPFDDKTESNSGWRWCPGDIELCCRGDSKSPV